MNNGVTNPTATVFMLQINPNHCRLAQDLFFQNVVQIEVHVAIVSKSYTVGEAWEWYTDHTALVAINVSPNCLLAPSEVEMDDGFVAAEIGGV